MPVDTEPADAHAKTQPARTLHFYHGMPAEMRDALAACERAMAATTARAPDGHAGACARLLSPA